MFYRIWQDGYLTVDHGRPLDTIRKTVAAAEKVEDPTCVVVDLTDRHGTGSRRGDLHATWGNKNVRFAALLSLRVARSDPHRVDWVLAAACTRPWLAAFTPPVDVLGLATELMAHDQSTCTFGPDTISCRNINPPSLLPGFGANIASMIKDPQRCVGVLLLPQRDYPAFIGSVGMVATFAVDEAGRAAINDRLPTRGLRKNEARLYMPASDAIPDVTARIIPSTVPNAITIGIDQLIAARQRTPLPQRWQDDLDVREWWSATDPFTLPAAPTPDAAKRPDVPANDAGTHTDQALQQARQQITILRQQTTSAETALAQALKENQLLREQAAGRGDEDNLRSQLVALQNELDRCISAFDDVEAERDSLRRRNGLLTAWQAQVPDVSAMPGGQESGDFATFAELLDAARETLSGLVITADPGPAIALDNHPKAAAWRRKAWDSLRTLNAYVTARTGGSPCDPAVTDVLAFARTGQPGSLISANIVKLGESTAVTSNERCHQARVFPVDTVTDASGRVFYGAHIALERFKPPAPRLHFFDDVAGNRVVYVGYLGEHLPTLRTN